MSEQHEQNAPEISNEQKPLSEGTKDRREVLYAKIQDMVGEKNGELTDNDWKRIHTNVQNLHSDECKQCGIQNADDLKSFALQTNVNEKKRDPYDLSVEEEKQCERDFMGYDERVPGLAKLSVAQVEKFSWFLIKYRSDTSHFLFEPLHIKRIRESPHAKEILLAAAQREPVWAFDPFDKYKDLSYGMEIVRKAIFSPRMNLEGDFLKKRLDDREKFSAEESRIVEGMIEDAKKHRRDVAMLTADKIHPEKSKDLFEDEGLEGMPAVKDAWIDWSKAGKNLNNVEKIQYRAMIARNLYFQDQSVTKYNVEKEFERIIQTRDVYKNINLFKERNVLMGVHNETFAVRNRFGTLETQNAIKKQMGKNKEFTLVRPFNTVDSLKEGKGQVLEKIRTSTPPFTFMFDGHGGPDALYFCDGNVSDGKVQETQNTIKITAVELASAFRERAKKFPSLETAKPDQKDIVILSTCFNSTFIREFHRNMGNAPKPMCIGASEYGQFGYSDLKSPYGAKFFSNVLNLQSEKEVTTIGTVFEHEFESESNPSIYIPDDKNRTMQITKDDMEQRPTRAAA